MGVIGHFFHLKGMCSNFLLVVRDRGGKDATRLSLVDLLSRVMFIGSKELFDMVDFSGA